ncbi:hypothetical protein [Tenacibaculum geojense]|uniref:Uncharacterized protein n=1 Tax=Tenacibaculum geojense TaxID=915352 RepID=A0ABW3JVG7_9FLAO
MKKYLYYLVLFLGFSALVSEVVNSFEETKLSYATFNSYKYFVAEEFKDTLCYAASGTNVSHDLKFYQGYLIKNKVEASLTGYKKFIDKIRLKNGNIPVWFCNINGVSELVFRTKSSPPNKPFFKIYFYVFCWIGSIYSLISLKKLKDEK